MSLFASLIAVTRLDSADVGDVVSQAVRGEYWPCLSRRLVSSLLVQMSHCCHLLLPPPTSRTLCDRSVCHSINRITDECGNGRRPNLAGMGKG